MGESMEFNEVQNSVHGRVSDYGAIFMSNATTKKECFERKLFGLPASFAFFVEQVKSGMVLFLFEYERRELHGVFQACSDGGMDIVPHAFRSSGRNFPAQVKFNQIWCCSPLSEDEFYDAIKDNYFSENKFNFGLSNVQVYRLLRLFSSRKLKYPLPQRQLTRSKVAREIGYSLGKVRRVPDGRFVMNERVSIEHDIDNERASIMSTNYPRDSSGKVGAHEHGAFATSDRIANEHKMDSGYAYPGLYLPNGRFVTSDGLDTEGDGVGQENHGLHQSNINTSFYSGKSIVEDDTLVQYQPRQSSIFSQSTGPQISNLSHPQYDRDKIGSRTLPSDPDAPRIHSRQLSTLGVDHSSSIVQQYSPQDSIFSSFGKKSFPLQLEMKGIDGYPTTNPAFLNNLPTASPDPHEFSRCRTSMPLPGPAYSVNRVMESSSDVLFPKSSLVNLCSTESGYNRRNSKDPSSYLFSPSKNPSFLFDKGFSDASQVKIEDKTPWHENNDVFPVNLHLMVQGCGALEPRSLHYHENYPFSKEEHYQAYQHIDKMYSSYQKNRVSVFSRLASPQEIYVEENETHVGNGEYDIDTSVDEVMAMLCQSHSQWARSETSNPVINHHRAVEIFRNYKQPTTKLERNFWAIISNGKKMKDNIISGENADISGENVDQVPEGTAFVNFKRRSEVRKSYDDSKIRDCGKSVESEGPAGGNRKRRKLIRPDFSINKYSNNKGIDSNTPENLQVPSQEGTTNEALVGSQENKKKLSQSVEMLHMMLQICHECKDTKKENEKQPSQTVVNQNVSHSVSFKDESHNAEEESSIKDSVVDELHQDYERTGHCIGQQSSLMTPKEPAENRIAFGGTECDGGNGKELLQNVENVSECYPTSGEIAIAETNNISRNQPEELKMEPGELFIFL